MVEDNRTPFEKMYEELSDNEKRLWDRASEVLNEGNRLYGQSPTDSSHVWWTLGIALASLREARAEKKDDDKSVIIYLEIGIDDTGFFVAPLQPDPSAENSDATAADQSPADNTAAE